MLNLIQHLRKSRTYETLNEDQFRVTDWDFLRDHQ